MAFECITIRSRGRFHSLQQYALDSLIQLAAPSPPARRICLSLVESSVSKRFPAATFFAAASSTSSGVDHLKPPA
jgi:hypothetical protein